MKTLFLKSTILIAFSLLTLTASAYDCEVDGIYYNQSIGEWSIRHKWE